MPIAVCESIIAVLCLSRSTSIIVYNIITVYYDYMLSYISRVLGWGLSLWKLKHVKAAMYWWACWFMLLIIAYDLSGGTSFIIIFHYPQKVVDIISANRNSTNVHVPDSGEQESLSKSGQMGYYGSNYQNRLWVYIMNSLIQQQKWVWN